MECTLGPNTFSIACPDRRSSSLPSTMKLRRRRIQSHCQLARLDSRPFADTDISEAQRYTELNKLL